MISVNLTTTYQRLNLCRIALSSLLLQSRLPDQVNLWVSEQPYLRDKGISDNSAIKELIDSLPEATRSLVCVRWVANTGPYRKLIPMLREADPDDVIVTADDDIFYGKDWLRGLLDAYKNADGKPVASRVRAKRANFLGAKTSYIYWGLINQTSVVCDDFVVTFGGGSVLARAMFREQDIADDSFLSVAPTADDLWYSKLLMLNHNEVVVVPSIMEELNFIQHNDGLGNHNWVKISSFVHRIRVKVWDRIAGFLGVAICGNDIACRNIDKYFQ